MNVVSYLFLAHPSRCISRARMNVGQMLSFAKVDVTIEQNYF